MSTPDSPGPVHHHPARRTGSASSPSADSPEEPTSPGPPPGSIPGQRDEVEEPRTHGRHAADVEVDREAGVTVEGEEEPKSPGPSPGTVPGNF
jgi:hypothetical protein